MFHFSVCQIAADGCGISAGRFQRTLIQTAGSDFHLLNPAVSSNRDGFRSGLPAVISIVSQAVIEHIPLSADAFDAAMGVAGVVHSVPLSAVMIADVAG